VIVPAHDAEATLPRTLACLAAQEAPFDYEVLVVDNGSRDATADVAASAGAPVRLVRTVPGGPGASRNLGARESSGQAIAFCDADCFPTSGWLAAGVAALEHADLVQGHVRPEPHVAMGPFDRSLWITSHVGLWQTANLFVSHETFERVGGFEDWLSLPDGRPFGEDVWFGCRAQRLGARAAFCAEALSHHAVFPRGPKAYVTERGRLRHFPAMVKRVPELRDGFLYRRVFLDARTARLDLALGAAVLAVALRRPWLLAATAPYARELRRAARRGGPPPATAAVDLAADLLGAAALLRGSIFARAPVL
jgi:glycosyltransferase involved in cell wall biosynthesis